MATDFNYNNKTIDSGGPIKPSGTDQPGDPRTRVDFYSDIKLIPNPYIGMIVTVKMDETNQNKMTDYKVLSLKANALGIANSVIDRVQRYVEYLGVSAGGSVSQEEINTAVSNYFVEHPVSSGATAEQAAQIESNKTAIGDENSGLIKEINYIKNIEITNLKTTVGNSNSGLIKDVNDLKQNGVSQDNINTAVSDYLSKNPIDVGITLRDVVKDEIFIVSTVKEVYGNIIISNPSINVSENSYTTFTVKLDKAPTNNQTISISLDNQNCSIDKTTLLFTPQTYANEQTVKVTGASDPSYENKASIITLSSNNVPNKIINVTIDNIDVEPVLNDISAVYTQGSTKVYPDTPLDSLKNNLVVMANYSNGNSNRVNSYTLSGTLTEGTSVITVNYNNKTTTFNVSVISRPVLSSITAVYNQGNKDIHPSTDLNSLKDDLIVTANYSDGVNETISDYILEGTLNKGISTITVKYSGLTTTFDVNVTEVVTDPLLFKFDGTMEKEATAQDKVAIIKDFTNKNTISIPCANTATTFVPTNKNADGEYISSINITPNTENLLTCDTQSLVMRINVIDNTKLVMLYDNKTGGTGYCVRINEGNVQLMDGRYLYLNSPITNGKHTIVALVDRNSKYGAIYIDKTLAVDKTISQGIKPINDKPAMFGANSTTTTIISGELYNRILIADEINSL